MTFDVAIVGSPFLDLTFEGLPRMPGPGQEVYGRALHVSPGGTGMQAVGAARLGLRTALVSPVGRDLPGRFLREAFEAEGVSWMGPSVQTTPVTALVSVPDGPAMATFHPEDELSPEHLAEVDAQAFVFSFGRLGLRAPGTRVYAVTGPVEAERMAGRVPVELRGVHACIANRVEAAAFTGESEPEVAARVMAGRCGTAVVTMGAEGAVAVEGDRVARANGPSVEAVDVVGAGDLFVSAYVWADLGGMALEERLSWATLYAGLSVRTVTPLAGAMRLEELLDEGRRAGLVPAATVRERP